MLRMMITTPQQPERNSTGHQVANVVLWSLTEILFCAGDSPVNPADPGSESSCVQSSKTEVSLTLTSKFDIFKDSDDQPDARGLLLRYVRFTFQPVSFMCRDHHRWSDRKRQEPHWRWRNGINTTFINVWVWSSLNLTMWLMFVQNRQKYILASRKVAKLHPRYPTTDWKNV